MERQLKEFAGASLGLFWQRQATYAGVTALTAYFLNLNIALFCYSVCQLSELFALNLEKRVIEWDGQDPEKAKYFLNRMTIGSAFSSIAVVQYVIFVALAEGPVVHFGPLFFLFAAALYAAMNNAQVPRVLVARMVVYSIVMVGLPLYDLLIVKPPLDHELWKELWVVLFVLYFLVECSRQFLRNYQTGQLRMDELRVERDRVTKAYELQSQFVSVVSHELRTPMTSVKGSLDLMTSGTLGTLPVQVEQVAKIAQKNSNRLAILIDDILDFQKLKDGNMEYRLSRIDLSELVRDAVEVNRTYGELRGISIGYTKDTGALMVDGDSDRLMQVLTNVLSNAVKFSHAGGRVEVTVQRSNNKARVLVRDFGIGIPHGAEETVFRPFSQVQLPENRAHGGTGLGMSISKQILDAHGGKIEYESKLGAGTTFVIDLNLAAGRMAQEPAPAQPVSAELSLT